MDSNEAKKAYNNALRAARAALKCAIRLREQIISEEPHYSGPSLGKLQQAHDLATSARRFSVE